MVNPMVTSFQTIFHSIPYCCETLAHPFSDFIFFFHDFSESSSSSSSLFSRSLAFLISFLGFIRRINNQLIRIRIIPPTYSPTTNCHPRNMEIMIPNSTTRLVEARRKAIEETKLAPFLNKLFVDASAAKLQELLINPKKVPSNRLLDSSLPMVFCILFSVTKT